MSRRPQRGDVSSIVDRLIKQLEAVGLHVDAEVGTRDKVLKLLAIRDSFRDLGISVIEKPEEGDAGKHRIRRYLRENPNVVLGTEEFEIISGISEYARRIREIRVEEGYHIWTGNTVRAMLEAGDVKPGDLPDEILALSPSEYYLVDPEPDTVAAERWSFANSLRRESGGMKDKLLKYFRRYVGEPLSGEELDYVADGKRSWPRRVRELRTEEGWPIKTCNTGRPDLPGGYYILEDDRQSPPHDRRIPDAVRMEVLERDGYACRKCGWSRDDWNPDDPRNLIELHHALLHVVGGTNDGDNLVALCNVCHDEVHRLKLNGRDALMAWLAS